MRGIIYYVCMSIWIVRANSVMKVTNNLAMPRIRNFMFLATLLLGISAVTVPSVAQAETCYLCPGVMWTYTTIWMELPSWPGCPVKFKYASRVCPDGTTEIIITEWDFPDPNDPDCAGLLATIRDAAGNTIWAGVEQVDREAVEILPKVLFMNAYNNALPGDKAQFECPNGKKLYRGVVASCHRWVEIQRWAGQPHFSQMLEWVVRLENCNDEACCIETQEICFDTQTNQLVVNVTMDEIEGRECVDLPDPTDPDAIAWSECMMWDCPAEQ